MSSWVIWSLSCAIHLAMLLMLALLTIGSAIVPGAKLLLHFENADRSTSSDERLFEFSSALESALPNVDDDVVSTLEEPALLEDISSIADLALKTVDSTLDQEVSSGLQQDLYSVVSNLENVTTVAFPKRGGRQQGTAKGRAKGKGEPKEKARRARRTPLPRHLKKAIAKVNRIPRRLHSLERQS